MLIKKQAPTTDADTKSNLLEEMIMYVGLGDSYQTVLQWNKTVIEDNLKGAFGQQLSLQKTRTPPNVVFLLQLRSSGLYTSLTQVVK